MLLKRPREFGIRNQHVSLIPTFIFIWIHVKEFFMNGVWCEGFCAIQKKILHTLYMLWPQMLGQFTFHLPITDIVKVIWSIVMKTFSFTTIFIRLWLCNVIIIIIIVLSSSLLLWFLLKLLIHHHYHHHSYNRYYYHHHKKILSQKWQPILNTILSCCLIKHNTISYLVLKLNFRVTFSPCAQYPCQQRKVSLMFDTHMLYPWFRYLCYP